MSHFLMHRQRLLQAGLLTALATGCAMEPQSYVGTAPQAEPGTVVVDLDDGTTLEQARRITGLELEWVSPLSEDEALASASVPNVAAVVDALEGRAGIEVVESSLPVEALGWPDDPLLERQWNMRVVGAETGWRVGAGRGVTVAVIDTGVTRVADLNQTTLLEGATFVSGTQTSADDNGHGTHVAGTIAQSTNNGIGVAGVAYEAEILPIKVLSGRGFGRSEWVAAGIDEAVDQGADVINLSLGGSNSRVIQNAVRKAIDAGVVVVAAAGNSGRQGVGCPANVAGVIAVSATGPDDNLAFYSSWGPEVFLSAPGGNKRQEGGGILQDTIASTPEGHTFAEFQGTSMATPHVAGAAAVLLSAGAGSPTQIKDVLRGSAVDLGTAGHDPKYGHGRLSISTAVRHLAMHVHGGLFAMAAMAGFAMATIGGVRRARMRMTVTAAFTAGGLFFLPLLPLMPSPTVELLAVPLLNWPSAIWSTHWAANPLWLSALLPVLLTFFLGPVRFLGPVVAGLSTGIGIHLLHGAFGGSLDVAWLPSGLEPVWLATNGLLALLAALAGAGMTTYQNNRNQRDV